MAKRIIKLICAVGEKINNDKDVGDLLKLVFYPDYNVSGAEILIPGKQACAQSGGEAQLRLMGVLNSNCRWCFDVCMQARSVVDFLWLAVCLSVLQLLT
jgi:hypothetical protein